MTPRFAGLAALALAAACGSRPSGSNAPGSAPDAGVAPVQSYSPDIPTWRGGCFFDYPAGQTGGPSKIVNGSPSPDVHVFGRACDPQPGPGGLVYLDRYDPVAGTGDVTVLDSAQGSAPVVIGRSGGAGGIVNGSAGARFDDQQTRVLTLADVSFVSGQLVMADLPSGAPVHPIASRVRVENYEFLPDGSVFFVGNYDATNRVGDLFTWNEGAPQSVDTLASRFDFVMYRMAPGRGRVAYLKAYTTDQGGDLFVQTLPPGPPAARIDPNVLGMTWTADGQRLVYQARNPDGVTFSVKVWDAGTGTPPRLVAGAPPAAGVNASDVVGDSIVYADGWNVLSQQASLHVVPASGGPESLAPSSPVSLSYGIAQPPAADEAGALAFVSLPDPSNPFSGDLFLAPVPSGSATLTPVDDTRRDSPEAGFSFGPRAGFVAWARDFQRPLSSGSASSQPGIAGELVFAPVSGGSGPFILASSGSMQWIGWDPRERWVAGLGGFQPAGNYGDLLVRDTATGALVFSDHRVAGLWFDFGDDGTWLAAIRNWDEALQRGELVLAPTTVAPPWTANPLDEDVTFYLRPRGGRLIYGVRGGGRDGLWLGGAP